MSSFLASGSAFHDNPQLADMSLGTGMIRPGSTCALQNFSTAMACVVLSKVMMRVGFFSLIRLWFDDQISLSHSFSDHIHIGYISNGQLIGKSVVVEAGAAGQDFYSLSFHGF